MASGAANTILATSTLEGSVQVGLSPVQLEMLGGWIGELREKSYNDKEINAIARTWVAKEDASVDEFFDPAWKVLKARGQALNGQTKDNEMSTVAFQELAETFTAGHVEKPSIAALLSEADPDRDGHFGMDEFVPLMRGLNITDNRGQMATEREQAREWMKGRMSQQKAMDRLRHKITGWESELLRHMVTRMLIASASSKLRMRSLYLMLTGNRGKHRTLGTARVVAGWLQNRALRFSTVNTGLELIQCALKRSETVRTAGFFGQWNHRRLQMRLGCTVVCGVFSRWDAFLCGNFFGHWKAHILRAALTQVQSILDPRAKLQAPHSQVTAGYRRGLAVTLKIVARAHRDSTHRAFHGLRLKVAHCNLAAKTLRRSLARTHCAQAQRVVRSFQHSFTLHRLSDETAAKDNALWAVRELTRKQQTKSVGVLQQVMKRWQGSQALRVVRSMREGMQIAKLERERLLNNYMIENNCQGQVVAIKRIISRLQYAHVRRATSEFKRNFAVGALTQHSKGKAIVRVIARLRGSEVQRVFWELRRNHTAWRLSAQRQRAALRRVLGRWQSGEMQHAVHTIKDHFVFTKLKMQRQANALRRSVARLKGGAVQAVFAEIRGSYDLSLIHI
eukprot:TRINITY_DN5723_c0_g2_i3.p1 TRINITY_DN5723_c0_g2~~TRINITY_DN5723_c0_g2_i3.p1  ORF type:complete len:620 (-),score=131.23 TRINITY_DN5723_c0_g2_i3:134-1993(-)